MLLILLFSYILVASCSTVANIPYWHYRPFTLELEEGSPTLTDVQIPLSLPTTTFFSLSKMTGQPRLDLNCSEMHFTQYFERTKAEVSVDWWIEACGAPNPPPEHESDTLPPYSDQEYWNSMVGTSSVAWIRLPFIDRFESVQVRWYYGSKNHSRYSDGHLSWNGRFISIRDDYHASCDTTSELFLSSSREGGVGRRSYNPLESRRDSPEHAHMIEGSLDGCLNQNRLPEVPLGDGSESEYPLAKEAHSHALLPTGPENTCLADVVSDEDYLPPYYTSFICISPFAPANFCSGDSYLLPFMSSGVEGYGSSSHWVKLHPQANEGRYIRGRSSTPPSSMTGGYSTHTHGWKSCLAHTPPHTDAQMMLNGTNANASTLSHSHLVDGEVNETEVVPPFLYVMFAVPDEEKCRIVGEDAGNPIMIGTDAVYMISHPDGTIPPLGFSAIVGPTAPRMLRGTFSEQDVGAMDGSFEHSHHFKTLIDPLDNRASPPTEIAARMVSNGTAGGFSGGVLCSQPHQHDVSNPELVLTSASEVMKELDTLVVEYVRRKSFPNGVGLTLGDEQHMHDEEEAIDFWSRPEVIVALLVSINVLWCVVLVVVCIGVFALCFWRQKAAVKKQTNAEQLLRTKLLSQGLSQSRVSAILPDSSLDPANGLPLDENRGVAFVHEELKRYEIPMEDIDLTSVIDSGGSGAIIYRAIWTEQVVAFKVFRSRSIFEQAHFEDFERELEIMSQVSHPNVLRFFGATFKPPRVGIVMEYCENSDLQSFIETRKLEDEEVPLGRKLRILLGICSGLEYLHKKNIVHRDLKSQNILLNDSLVAKIIDFGLSRIIEKSDRHTQCGTSHYMAPEVVLGRTYNQSCDVFSLSIVIFELLTECFNPYHVWDEDAKRSSRRSSGAPSFALEYRVANDPLFRPVVDREPSLQDADLEWLVSLMQECWSHHPDDRPQVSQLISEVKKRVDSGTGSRRSASTVVRDSEN